MLSAVKIETNNKAKANFFSSALATKCSGECISRTAEGRLLKKNYSKS